jgi:hypothetical protein
MIGLRHSLAPKMAARVEALVGVDAFAGQTLDTSDPDFLILAANRIAAQKAGAPIKGEKNRVKPGPGLIFFDGSAKLGFTTRNTEVGLGWICVGQLQAPAAVVQAWRSHQPSSAKILYFGNLRG